MSDINCPYCDHVQEVCQDDGQYCGEDKYEEMQCYECEKYFMVTTHISFNHTPHKADCLNVDSPEDKDHDWSYITTTNPKRPRYRECNGCGLEEVQTKEVWDRHLKALTDGYENELKELAKQISVEEKDK